MKEYQAQVLASLGEWLPIGTWGSNGTAQHKYNEARLHYGRLDKSFRVVERDTETKEERTILLQYSKQHQDFLKAIRREQ